MRLRLRTDEEGRGRLSGRLESRSILPNAPGPFAIGVGEPPGATRKVGRHSGSRATRSQNATVASSTRESSASLDGFVTNALAPAS